ncbi:MAG: threonylcarbamoyl-AMP synthase [Clostridia bacterium]|nr:threonylcarbamoyl-AMP synthase [Clostridia bacterium]
MNTQKLKTEASAYRETVEKSAAILKNGGIVAIPTETVYGLAASALDDNAIKKVFTAKGRPQDNPLIVHISSMDTLFEIAQNIPEKALLCAEKFWPGPLTMVLERTDKTAKSVSAGLNTVAVRMPDNSVALDVITVSGLPLAAPSANTSGSPSPTKAEHVEADLDGKIDAIIFSEECAIGVESTVVSFCCNPPRLLRPGAVTAEQLREILPDLVIDSAVLAEPEKDARVESPGVKYKHYAPKTEAFLVEGNSADFAGLVNSKPDSAAICFAEEADGITVPKLCYGTSENEFTLAHEVFSVLRRVDDLGVKQVYIHAPSKNGVGLAVYNRLLRAAAFRVITL